MLHLAELEVSGDACNECGGFGLYSDFVMTTVAEEETKMDHQEATAEDRQEVQRRAA